MNLKESCDYFEKWKYDMRMHSDVCIKLGMMIVTILLKSISMREYGNQTGMS